MSLSALQSEVLRQLRLAVSTRPAQEVTYCAEWLGELPFGAYQWVQVDGDRVSNTFPSDWQFADIQALEGAGFLRRVGEWQNPDDGYELQVRYVLAEP
jgi:hypothetical protein